MQREGRMENEGRMMEEGEEGWRKRRIIGGSGNSARLLRADDAAGWTGRPRRESRMLRRSSGPLGGADVVGGARREAVPADDPVRSDRREVHPAGIHGAHDLTHLDRA